MKERCKRGIEIRIRGVEINFSNKWLYTFIAIGILAIIGVAVYALTPGVAPNPGHLIDNVAPPAGCADGQVLGWDGSAWGCVSGGTSLWSQGGSDIYSDIYYNPGHGRVGIGTASPEVPLHVRGTIGDAEIIASYEDSVKLHLGANSYEAFIGTRTDHDFWLRANNGNWVIIKTDGKVGIGTTSPRAKLEVAGGIQTSSAAVTVGDSCSSSQWGEIRRCYHYGNERICGCMYVTSNWKWREFL